MTRDDAIPPPAPAVDTAALTGAAPLHAHARPDTEPTAIPNAVRNAIPAVRTGEPASVATEAATGVPIRPTPPSIR